MQPITLASHAIWPSGLCTMQVAARATSADSLAESEMSATLPDSNDEESDDSEASDGEDTEWEPQQGAPPPVADGVTKLAEGILDADVKEVYSRLLADQVCHIDPLLDQLWAWAALSWHSVSQECRGCLGKRCEGVLQPSPGWSGYLWCIAQRLIMETHSQLLADRTGHEGCPTIWPGPAMHARGRDTFSGS